MFHSVGDTFVGSNGNEQTVIAVYEGTDESAYLVRGEDGTVGVTNESKPMNYCWRR